MAKQVEVNQSVNEGKIYPLDFRPALLTDVTVTDVTFEYEGDNEDESPPTFSLLEIDDDNIAYIQVSGLALGFHRLKCLAETDNENLSPEIVLLITTNY